MPPARDGIFPLVPRHRLAGLPLGTARSWRRGRGTDLAASRPYEPGDPISTIDWRASARLSTARGEDLFVVRQRFAEEAPRVVVLADRRPSMALYPPGLPWLSKRDAALAAMRAILASSAAARSPAGYLDLARSAAGSPGPFWIPPQSRQSRTSIEERADGGPFDAPEDALTRGLRFLGRAEARLTPGSFVFVLSDFLAPPEPAEWVVAARRRWELVPVVIQDPVWEQSFPDVGRVVVPLRDPADGRIAEVRLRRREARELKERNESRLRSLLGSFAAIGSEPVLLSSSDPLDVAWAFLAWAERRQALWGRR
jgi:uncharacterized protein (DUF58 family)